MRKDLRKLQYEVMDEDFIQDALGKSLGGCAGAVKAAVMSTKFMMEFTNSFQQLSTPCLPQPFNIASTSYAAPTLYHCIHFSCIFFDCHTTGLRGFSCFRVARFCAASQHVQHINSAAPTRMFNATFGDTL